MEAVRTGCGPRWGRRISKRPCRRRRAGKPNPMEVPRRGAAPEKQDGRRLASIVVPSSD
uniref:Uncharacterized protein n=1 Tax=Arundo donax TaxID=35708 RepID=A0A0A9AJV9_ARUDO